MARIELRDAVIYFKDGLSGTATVEEATPAEGDTNIDVATVVLNTTDTDKIPVGARFTVAGHSATTYTVTGRTPAEGGPTTNIVFTPAIPVGGAFHHDDVITFTAQRVEVKTGKGNLTWTESKEYEYELDRGDLDTVREKNQVPLDVKLDCVYEHITTGTNETITPLDAVKGSGEAHEWVSSSSDLCEPYAVDIEVVHTPPCGAIQTETILFPDFRADKKDMNIGEATISLAGRCNVTEPTVTRA